MVITTQQRITFRKVKKVFDIATIVLFIGVIVAMKIDSWRWGVALTLAITGLSQVSTVLGLKSGEE